MWATNCYPPKVAGAAVPNVPRDDGRGAVHHIGVHGDGAISSKRSSIRESGPGIEGNAGQSQDIALKNARGAESRGTSDLPEDIGVRDRSQYVHHRSTVGGQGGTDLKMKDGVWVADGI